MDRYRRVMVRLLVVRHGQSTWNANGRWQGQADPPLSELGRRQAIAAAEGVGAIDAIWASDLQRASTTAELIAEELGIGPVHRDPDLRERSAGPWEGLTRAEIHAGWPGYLDDDRRPDGWEDDESVARRAERALVRVVELVGEGDVLVVSHQGTLNAVVRRAAPGLDYHRTPNLGGWVLEPNANGARFTVVEQVVLIDHATVPDAI